ncbi:hypothetical protein I553_8636 [Mycobacterium xenopi 4042]|uniref:Uncharacterized protein n=1 Tax=Mycobacterium xenopi 4042 TaxID=1299334 RepID=X8CMA6_MYCXE|nr:hypothetical protein I553_8636 [Mycobacterium xenopi 4042]
MVWPCSSSGWFACALRLPLRLLACGRCRGPTPLPPLGFPRERSLRFKARLRSCLAAVVRWR